MGTKKLQPSTKVTKYLSAVTEGKAHGKKLSVAVAQIRDGAISADGSKLVMRYKLYINDKPILSTSIATAEMIKYAANAFLALKIVEIIGEDEPYQLDPETIYFVTNLLNKMNLLKFS